MVRYLLAFVVFLSQAHGEFVAIAKDTDKSKDGVRAYGASSTSEKEALDTCQKNSQGMACTVIPRDSQVVIYRRSDNQGRLGMAWELIKKKDPLSGEAPPIDYMTTVQEKVPETADEIARADCEVLLSEEEKNNGISCNQIMSFNTPLSVEPNVELAERNQKEEQGYFVVVAREKNSRAYGASQTSLSMAQSLCQKFSSGADCIQIPRNHYVTITQRSDYQGRLGIGVAKEKNATDMDAGMKAGDEAQKDCEAQLKLPNTGVTCNQVMQYFTKE